MPNFLAYGAPSAIAGGGISLPTMISLGADASLRMRRCRDHCATELTRCRSIDALLDQEVEAGALADALDQAINCVRRERPAALRKAAERTIPCLRRRIGSFACTITAREARNYQPQPQRQPLKKHPQPPHRQPPQPLKPPAAASAAAA